MENSMFAVIGVLLGWFLVQGADLIKNWWNNKRIRKALLTELEDLQQQLEMLEQFYVQELQLVVHETVYPELPIRLANPIYIKHYTDVFLKLNYEQRNSYQTIHGLIERMNATMDLETKLVDQSRQWMSDKEYSSILKILDGIKRIQFVAIHELKWRIHYHINNKNHPVLGDADSREYKNLLKYEEKVLQDLHTILKNAKQLDPKKIDTMKTKRGFNLGRTRVEIK